MRLHRVHGEDITLSEGGRVARRRKNQSAGLVFSEQPLKVEQTVRLKVSQEPLMVLVLGVTRRDPTRMKVRNLKETRHKGSWCKHLISPSHEFNVKLTLLGELLVDSEVFLTGLDVTKKLWALFELIGKDCRLEILEEPLVKRRWNYQHALFEETTVGMVSLACCSKAAISEGLGYVFIKVALGEVVVIEVLEAKSKCKIKVGFTSTEPAVQENTDYFYTAVNLAEDVKTGEIISLYPSRTGEVRSNKNGGEATTLLFVDPEESTLWTFLELEGRMAVRALTTSDLYVEGEALPALWETTRRTIRRSDLQDNEEVVPINHPLPASPAPPITEEQIISKRNSQLFSTSVREVEWLRNTWSRVSINLPSTRSSEIGAEGSSSSERRRISNVGERSPASTLGERRTIPNAEERTPISNIGERRPISNPEERSTISNIGGMRPISNAEEMRPISTVGETRPISKGEEMKSSSVIGERGPISTIEEKKNPISNIRERRPISNAEERSPISNIGERRPISKGEEMKPTSVIGERKPISIAREMRPISTVGERRPAIEEKSPISTIEEKKNPISAIGERSPISNAGDITSKGNESKTTSKDSALKSFQDNEDAMSDTPECCICFEKPPNTAIYDCGHLCLCYKCAKRQKKVFGKCPICNKQILDIMKIFKV